MAGSGPTIEIPRWIQLVVLPVVLVLAFLLARTLGQVLFLFLTASVIAFTLNPLVRDLTRLRVPRVLSVFIVYSVFVAAVCAILFAIGFVAYDQARAVETVIKNVEIKGNYLRVQPWSLWGGTAVMVMASLTAVALQWKTISRAFLLVAAAGLAVAVLARMGSLFWDQGLVEHARRAGLTREQMQELLAQRPAPTIEVEVLEGLFRYGLVMTLALCAAIVAWWAVRRGT